MTNTNTNTNTAITLNKTQMVSLTAIYDATDRDLFVPKNDPAAQKIALKEIGVSARIFGVLFEKNCLKWARLEDGTTVASLTAKCARMVDAASASAATPEQTISEPVMPETSASVEAVKLSRRECYEYLVRVAKLYDTKVALRAEGHGVADLREMVRKAMESAAAPAQAEPVSTGVSALSRAQIRALDTLVIAMNAAPITQAEYDAGSVDIISQRMFNFFFANKLLRIVRSRAHGPIIALTKEAKSLLMAVKPADVIAQPVTVPVATPAAETANSPASKRTRALRAKIEAELIALEAAIAEAEANGEPMSGKDIQKSFIINLM
jgi:hypothetical protein